ncbi:hypothetical protein [Nocardia cyriacigeorgica]
MVNELDSTESFMDALATSAPEYMANLAEIGKQLGWPRAKHVVPSAKWVAEQIDEDRPYEYLYSASSRAIHFPPGESMRRAWVDGDGMVTTRWGIHQTYLSDFALYQLTKLFLKTVSVALPWIDKGPKSSDDSDFFEFDIEKLKTSAPFPPCR